MAQSWAQWLLNNIGRACRWRGNTSQTSDGCGNSFQSDCTAGGHDCEGGVDIPLSAGTPIYSLAGGYLIGNGPWKGHGVITQNVQGIGKLYYQHLDVLPSFPQCVNGSCPSVYIPAGTLLGYSNDTGEVEVGINPAWGGIWGPPTNGAGWVDDPRQTLINLANGIGGDVTGPCVPCGTTLQCCSPKICVAARCIDDPTTIAGNAINGILPGWLQNPDWLRLLKMIGGIILLGTALLGLFWPQAEQVIGKVASTAELAA